MSDMSVNIFKEQSFGKVAMFKIGEVPENFRLYEAGWVGDDPRKSNVMKVTGAEFRVAKSGINKGKLSVRIPGTIRTVFVNSEEMKAQEL